MTNKKTNLSLWAFLMEENDEQDYLPPEHTPTDEELEIEKILAQDKNQQRWEQQARRAGVL